MSHDDSSDRYEPIRAGNEAIPADVEVTTEHREPTRESDYAPEEEREHRPAIDFAKHGNEGDFIPDWLVDRVLRYVTERTDFRDHIVNLKSDESATEEEIARACIASILQRMIRDPEHYVENAEHGDAPSAEDLAYQSLPFAAHKTTNFIQCGPGYAGPIWHLQFDGGPSMMVNVTRAKNADGKMGYLLHNLGN